jgi:fructose-1,6-bisphosphatase/inositol monophosphatase family enzyme
VISLISLYDHPLGHSQPFQCAHIGAYGGLAVAGILYKLVHGQWFIGQKERAAQNTHGIATAAATGSLDTRINHISFYDMALISIHHFTGDHKF